MEGQEHGEPLPLGKYRDSIHENNQSMVVDAKARRHRSYVECCGCTTAIILILAVFILVLNFTVFRFKQPVLELNAVTITGLDRVTNATLRKGLVVSVIADVSIKNPNVGSFKFGDGYITVYYGDVVVGEGGHPPGTAKAKRTLRMNVTVDFVAEKIFDVPRFNGDSSAGFLPMSSFSTLSGKVNMLNVMKRTFEVKLYCTMSYNISSQATQDEACDKYLSL